ncbi:MAG: hypothetical protein M3347_19205, partial [Armatimonadota bacterium]|nr:hypothetical protein [Armatimonadota bacterium]
SPIEGLVAAAIQSLAWSGKGRRVTRQEMAARGQVNQPGAWERLKARRFADYARKHGRPDLASEALRLGEATGRFQDHTRRLLDAGDYNWGLEERPFILAISLWWAAATLLLQLLLLVPLYLALGGLLRFSCVPLEFVARRRDFCVSVTISAISAALLIGGALKLGAGWKTVYYLGPIDLNKIPYWDPRLHSLILLGAILPVLITAWLCSTVTLWRQRKARRIAGDEHSFHFASFVVALGLWTLVLVMLGWWLLLLLEPNMKFQVPAQVPLLFPVHGRHVKLWPANPLWPLAGFTLGLLAIFACWLFSASRTTRPFIGYRLRWLHQALGGLILLASLAYLALSLAALPVRREADAQMDAFIRNGEIAQMKRLPND